MNAMRGIYAITNTVTGTVYYGQSSGTHKRLWVHTRDLRRGNHFNSHLQAAWNRDGEGVFRFLPLGEVRGDRTRWETALVQGGMAVYNMQDPMRVEPPSVETRERMSGAQLGKVLSQGTRDKISAALLGKKKPAGFGLGRKFSAETRTKMSVSNLGKHSSPETGMKISKALRGRKLSVEHCANISRSLLGNTRGVS